MILLMFAIFVLVAVAAFVTAQPRHRGALALIGAGGVATGGAIAASDASRFLDPATWFGAASLVAAALALSVRAIHSRPHVQESQIP